jgi:hypothetical protein
VLHPKQVWLLLLVVLLLVVIEVMVAVVSCLDAIPRSQVSEVQNLDKIPF